MPDVFRVAYRGIGDDLAYERSLLDAWGVAGRLDLANVDDLAADDAALTRILAPFDALVTEGVTLSGTLLRSLPRLRVVALQSIGTNTVDVATAGELGVEVSNAPGYCTQEVAAHAVGMILDLARRITFYDRAVQAGEWEPLPAGAPLPIRLSGRSVGLVFFGGIPQQMVAALVALGMHVLVYAPTRAAGELARWPVEKVETLDELLRRSDFVSLHSPLVEATRGLIGERELGLMKSSAALINTARGGVVDEDALVEALVSGRIAAAAVDVIADESTASTRLRGLANVIITPHVAYLSEESFRQAREMALRSVVDVLVDERASRYRVSG